MWTKTLVEVERESAVKLKTISAFLAAALAVTLLASCAPVNQPVEQTMGSDSISTTIAGTLTAGQTETAAEAENLAASVTALPSPGPTSALPTPEPTEPAAERPTEMALEPSPPPDPVREPDELIVAYVDPGRNVWVWTESEGARQLTTSGDVGDVRISDDGQWIAFTRTVDFTQAALWAVRSDGSQEKALMDIESFSSLPAPAEAVSIIPALFDWQPSTHTLVFTTRPTFEGPGLMLNDDLWLVNADTGEREELLEPGSGGRFTYSPDGSQIALTRPESISLVNADGSDLRENVITFPQVITYSEFEYYPSPVWSPDGSFLRVAIPPADQMQEQPGPTTIWEIPVDGSPAFQVGSVENAPFFYPVLSRDAAKIAYQRPAGDPALNRHELRIAAVDGSEDALYLTEMGLLFNNWALDSTRFVFTAGDTARSYLGQVGQVPQPLTDVSSVADVCWVDDNRFLFIVRSTSVLELRTGEVDAPSRLIYGTEPIPEQFLSYDFAVP